MLWPNRRRSGGSGETGPEEEEMHRQAGRHVAEKKIDVLVGVRGLAQAMVDAAKDAGGYAEFVASSEEAGEWLAREARDGDVVLLKASRGVKLEKTLETWQQKSGIPSATGAGKL